MDHPDLMSWSPVPNQPDVPKSKTFEAAARLMIAERGAASMRCSRPRRRRFYKGSLSPSELGSVDAIRECGLFAKLITYRVFSFSGAARDSSARPFILVSRR
jgi:hypothetical protein